MSEVVSEILKSQVHVTLGLIVLWTVLGVAAGMLLSLPAYAAPARLGAFKLEWRHGKWFRVLTYLWLFGVCAFCGGMTGCLEGGRRGIVRTVEKSRFRSEVLQPAGEGVAVALAYVDALLEDRQADPSERIDAFRNGERELNITLFIERLERTEETLVKDVVAAAMPAVRAKLKLPESRIIDILLEKALESLVRDRLKKVAEEKLGEEGVAGLSDFVRGLPAAAKANGDPDTIPYPELADHAVERGFIPAILHPANKIIRGKQRVLALLVPAAILIPALGFWVGRIFERRARKRKEAAPPPSASDASHPGTGPSPPGPGSAG